MDIEETSPRTPHSEAYSQPYSWGLGGTPNPFFTPEVFSASVMERPSRITPQNDEKKMSLLSQWTEGIVFPSDDPEYGGCGGVQEYGDYNGLPEHEKRQWEYIEKTYRTPEQVLPAPRECKIEENGTYRLVWSRRLPDNKRSEIVLYITEHTPQPSFKIFAMLRGTMTDLNYYSLNVALLQLYHLFDGL